MKHRSLPCCWKRRDSQSQRVIMKSGIQSWNKAHNHCSSAGKESACDAGDSGSIPGSRRSPGKGNSNPLQYSCLENPTDRRAWRATVHGVARVGHDLVTKPPLLDMLFIRYWSKDPKTSKTSKNGGRNPTWSQKPG